MKRGRAVLLVGVLLLPAPALAGTCGVSKTPSVASCAAGAAFAGGQLGLLSKIACIANAVNRWGAQVLACLEQQRTEFYKRIYPDSAIGVLDQVRDLTRSYGTIRQEAAKLSCNWRFTPRTNLWRNMFLTPVQFCKDEYRSLMGSHDLFADAGMQEFYDWSAVQTYEAIREHNIAGGPGDDGEYQGTEYAWERISREALIDLSMSAKSPGEAMRYHAQLGADLLRARADAVGLRSQAVTVKQLKRQLVARDKQLDEAWNIYWLLQSSGARERPGNPEGEPFPEIEIEPFPEIKFP